MPGSTPPTSQLDWLSSTTAMIVLSWSKATRDLLKSFSWGIGALRQLFASDDGAISFAACPIPSRCWREQVRSLGSPSESIPSDDGKGPRSSVIGSSIGAPKFDRPHGARVALTKGEYALLTAFSTHPSG